MNIDNPIETVCKHCGSSRIVPIVWGSLSYEMRLLELQGKIGLGGCFMTGVGSSMWECADCLEGVKDDRFLWQETETFPMRVYQQTLDQLFAEVEPVSEEEYAVLSGRSWLKTLIRSALGIENSKLTIFETSDGFEAKIHSDLGLRAKNYDTKSVPIFQYMLSFIRHHSPPGQLLRQARLTVRVDRSDQDFILSIEEIPGGTIPAIVVRRAAG